MSCSLCRLPFTPAPLSVSPYPVPEGIMDEKHFNYFSKAYVVGKRIPFNIFRCEYLGMPYLARRIRKSRTE